MGKKNIYLQNSNGTIDANWGLFSDGGDIHIDNSELAINCKDNTVLDAYQGKIILSDNIYVKSPASTKICQAEVDGYIENNVLCNADGSIVTSCVIAKKRVSDDICKISAIPAQNYTGASITPPVTATWNGTPMKEGTDFTVTYKNNTNAGTATATVAGKGNYTGTKDITFTITDSMPAGTKVKAGGQEYKVINATTAAFTKAKNKKSVTVPATITVNGRKFAVTQVNAKAFKGKKIRTVTIGKNVTKIKANAFKGSPATKLILKTKLLKKKTVKNALKGSKINTAQVKVGKASANKKIKKAYKKFFTKKVLGRNVTLK